MKCGCKNRSVPADVIEAEFNEIIGLLTVDTDALDWMVEMAIQADQQWRPDEGDFEQRKTEALALNQRRIDAAVNLYKDGVIDREEYLHRREQAEREITHWESRTSETSKVALEFSMCLEAVRSMKTLWAAANNEDKQGMVRNLFSYIVYDLDHRRIVDFRLKPWADRFLTMRAEHLAEENKNASSLQGEKRPMPPTGLHAIRLSA